MSDPFHIAATGLHAQEAHVDAIANNLANWNTTAYKKSRVDFEDLMYRQVASAAGLIGTCWAMSILRRNGKVSFFGERRDVIPTCERSLI